MRLRGRADSLAAAARYEELVPRLVGRDLGPRSGDDHYVLYTGGTTGLPKGVVWRQEDIFFAALGGGNPGGPPITDRRPSRASVLDNPAQRLRAFLPPDDPGPPQFVALALGPLDARQRPVVGARHAARRRQASCCTPSRTSTWRACSTWSSASASSR